MLHSRTRLNVESLASRIVPSAVTVPTTATTVAAIVHKHYALAGRGTGTYQEQHTLPDAGLTCTLSGTAQVADLGQVTVAGTLHGTGYISHGHAAGTLKLSNAKGSVTLELTGLPEQNGFAALPPYFRYRIVSGTGQFLHLSETGTLRIDMTRTGAATSNHGTYRIAI